MAFAGADDLERASNALLARVPAELGGFVELAFNFRWSWLADGAELFEAIDAHRWELCGGNPLRLLEEAPQSSLDRAARDAALLERVAIATGCVRGDLARRGDGRFTPERPVAFLCAEFGVHASLPIYAGGLGVLAGDMLKAASDRGLAGWLESACPTARARSIRASTRVVGSTNTGARSTPSGCRWRS